MKIAINPGHDTLLDAGACGEYLREADVTDNVAHIVLGLLQSMGHDAYFIQSNELHEISSMATATGAEIFISIHCNAAENPAAHGSETWYYPDPPSERLADCIQQNVVEALGTEDRGVKDGSRLAVLNSTEVEATVLVELAFISNAKEEELLNNNQMECAAGIVDGIVQYISMTEMIYDDE